MKIIMKRMFSILLAGLCMAIVFSVAIIGGINLHGVRARAESVADYEESNVLDDLKGSVINGENFSLLTYNFNPLKDTEVISFLEYGYTFYENYQDSFGLYVYVYNPKDLDYVKNSSRHAISLRVGSDTSQDYTKYPLTFINASRETNYVDLFYKFRVELTDIDKKTILSSLNSTQRVYSVGEIELLEEGAENATAVAVNNTYTYTGYMSGFASDSTAESTLKNATTNLETIKLNVGHTNYRFGNKLPDYANRVEHYELRDDLNTVYFSVPQKFFDSYGVLQKISAKWFETKTSPIFVTSDPNAKEAFLPFIGKFPDSTLNWGVFWDLDGYQYPNTLAYYYTVGNRYNFEEADIPDGADLRLGDNITPMMSWIFEKEGITQSSDFKLSREEMFEYIKWFRENNLGGELPLNPDLPEDVLELLSRVPAELILGGVDEDRKHLLDEGGYGWVTLTVDAGDKQTIIDVKEQSFWDRLWNGKRNEELDINPIVEVDPADINLSKADFCKKYYVNTEDYDGDNGIKKAFETAITNNEKFILFRFAVTDYSTSIAVFEYYGNSAASDPDGYVATETLFLDFDIISLTFRNERGDTVIAVVSDPQDIINGLDPPEGLGDKEIDWLMIILGVLGLILFLFVTGPIVFPIISFLLTLIWDIIKLPFKIIGDILTRKRE